MSLLRVWSLISILVGIVGSRVEAGAADATFLSLPVVEFGGQSTGLESWLVVGPYEARRDAAALDQDFLAGSGIQEGSMAPEAYVDLARRPAEGGAMRGRLCVAMPDRGVDFLHVFAKDIRPGDPQGAVYAACTIATRSACEAWLLAASDDSLTVWLNGVRLHSHSEPRPLHLYDDVVRLPLQPGSNFLLIKVANVIGSWELAARLEPSFIHAMRTLLSADSQVLRAPVIETATSLGLRTDISGATNQLLAVVHGPDGTSSASFPLGRELAEPPPGLYRVELFAGDASLGNAPLVARPAELLRTFEVRAETAAATQVARDNLDCLFRRWRALLQLEEKSRADRDWQQKLVYVVSEADDVLRRLESGREPFRGVPGLHLRAFRSDIDAQVQHYRIFVPPGRERAKVPLIVMLATSVSAARPFLESPFVANHKEAAALGTMAAELGVAIVWPGYRCTPYGNPCEFAHFEEVLRAVRRDYQIDDSRISLVGVCGAGMIAAMMADLFPTRFAAVGFVNPVLYRLKNRFDDNGTFNAEPGYHVWLQQTDPVERLATIHDLPMWIIHDGIDPDHGPLAHSVTFYEAARANGVPVQFDRVEARFSSRLPMWRSLFGWLAQQHRSSGDTTQTFSVAQQSGPVARAFAEPFLVVIPTAGSPAAQKAGNALAADFRAAWQRTQYGDCRSKLDVDVTADDLQKFNLVLLGNATMNVVWRRFEARLPVRLGNEYVEAHGRRFTGADLSVITVCRNPLEERRKVVLIGAAELPEANFGTMELAIDGWFDFAIWRKSGNGAALVGAERFAENAPAATATAGR